ncbi:MAG: DNA-3-methyladenine glycosylase [Verrucomicrobiales bacterium]
MKAHRPGQEVEQRADCLHKATGSGRGGYIGGQETCRLGKKFFEQPPLQCAEALLGYELVWGLTSGIVTEAEAYSERDDPACHTVHRPSARAFLEQNPAGTAYVYLNYGMYWLLNVVVKSPDECGFVLLRGLWPTGGIALMTRRRKGAKDLCGGPGKLGRALGLDGSAHGKTFLCKERYFRGPPIRPGEVYCGGRIGISRGQDLPWRFWFDTEPLRGAEQDGGAG